MNKAKDGIATCALHPEKNESNRRRGESGAKVAYIYFTFRLIYLFIMVLRKSVYEVLDLVEKIGLFKIFHDFSYTKITELKKSKRRDRFIPRRMKVIGGGQQMKPKWRKYISF